MTSLILVGVLLTGEDGTAGLQRLRRTNFPLATSRAETLGIWGGVFFWKLVFFFGSFFGFLSCFLGFGGFFVLAFLIVFWLRQAAAERASA